MLSKVLSVPIIGFALILLFASNEAKPIEENHLKISADVDKLIADHWKKANLTPSNQSDDAEFLRRIYLDIVGFPPAANEIVDFLKDTSKDKRQKVIDMLLANQYYAKNWADIWQTWLIGRDIQRRFMQAFRSPLHKWLEDALSKNITYDVLAQKLITAEGVSDENGGIVFLSRWSEEIPNMAGKTTSLFMGIRLQCAQCHDHPTEKWKMEQFWGIAGFFSRVRRQEIRDADNKVKAVELFDGRRGEAMLPNSTKVIEPKFLVGETPKMTSKDKRREVFAKLLISKDNPYFARAIVNRMWAHFFGRGFVNPIDDMTEKNTPSHPEVLDQLAKDFVDNGYDLKRLIRIITNSKAYQLSSKPSNNNVKDKDKFSRALLRPLAPEQLFYSLVKALSVEDIMKKNKDSKKGEDLEEFIQKALQRFTIIFEDDEMNEKLDFEGTVTQALFLMNGRFTNEFLNSKLGSLAQILNYYKTFEDRLNAIFLVSLCRVPQNSEKQKFSDYLKTHGDKPETWNDIFWVLLNSTEFFMNH